MGVHPAAAESGRDRDSTLDLTRHNFTATKLQLTSREVDWTASLTSDRAGIRIHRCTIVIGQPFIESVSGAETQAAIHAVISGLPAAFQSVPRVKNIRIQVESLAVLTSQEGWSLFVNTPRKGAGCGPITWREVRGVCQVSRID